MAADIVDALGAEVLDALDIPPRPAIYAEAPARYQSGAVGQWLTNFLAPSREPYSHQSLALRHVEAGRNIVVSTSTASGKSLIFMAAAIARLVEGQSTILAFYPLKALANDQRGSWERELERAGLPRTLVGSITGDIPMVERELAVERSRVLLATPDAVHSWLMPMSNSTAVRRFLTNLSLVVIDEAHSLEAVFGSQFALFFRRLRAAQRRACRT